MTLQQKIFKKNLSDFIADAQNLRGFEKESKSPKVDPTQRKECKPLTAFELRQFEQKQILLTALTRLLFEKFENISPTKKFSKFEFSDISWNKKSGTSH